MTRLIAALTFLGLILGAFVEPVLALDPSLRPKTRPVAIDPDAVPVPITRPRARPATTSAEAAIATQMAHASLPRMRPHLRPASEQLQAQAQTGQAQPVAFQGPDVSARPYPRPESVEQEALFGRRKKRKGSVCGDIDIQGTKVGRVPGKVKGCGVKDAVSIRSVSGVMLSRPATMTCETAKSLNRWVSHGVKPAFRRRGPVVEMKVAAHYACRTRNNQPGGRISEHGKGKAIDISAFTMKDGEVITVLGGWNQGAKGRMLRKVWKSACGPFGTVLGPNADRHHRDHFHVDTASYRSGPYCK